MYCWSSRVELAGDLVELYSSVEEGVAAWLEGWSQDRGVWGVQSLLGALPRLPLTCSTTAS